MTRPFLEKVAADNREFVQALLTLLKKQPVK